MDAASLEIQRNVASSSRMIARTMHESVVQVDEAIKMQMEVERRLHEQLQVQKHLHIRIEAQGKYMQSILEKAYQALAAQGMTFGELGDEAAEMGAMKNLDASAGFPSHLQQLYGGDQLDHLQNQMTNQPLDLFLLANDDSCISKRTTRSSTYHLQLGIDMDSMADVQEAKPMLSGNAIRESLEASSKMERSSSHGRYRSNYDHR